MENEDDILNVEFDPSEIENIDEDELLGGASSAHFGSNKPQESSSGSEIGTNSGMTGMRGKVKLEDVEEEDTNETSTHSGFSEDEAEEEDDKDRCKFYSERPVGPATHRPGGERSDIPDSLDKVKLGERERAFIRDGRKRGAGGRNQYSPNSGAKRVLLNPHFQGSVAMRPQLRLAWDNSCRQPMPHHLRMRMPLPLMDVRPPVSRPIHPPPLQRQLCPPNQLHMPRQVSPVAPMMQAGSMRPVPSLMNIHPQHPSMPLMHSMPSINVPSNSYRYPPPWSSARTSLPQPSSYPIVPLVSIASPSGASMMYSPMKPGVSLSPSSPVLRPVANCSAPSVRQCAPKPLSDLSGLTKQASSDEWLNMTEDFLRKTRMPPPFQRRVSIISDNPPRQNAAMFSDNSPQPMPASRQRQAAADVKRKYWNQTDRQKKMLFTAGKLSSESEATTPDGTKQLVEGVDVDYLRKMEEQKRMRERLLKQKEERRALMAKKRQQQLQQAPAVPNDKLLVVVAGGSGFAPVKRAEISLAASSMQQPARRRRI